MIKKFYEYAGFELGLGGGPDTKRLVTHFISEKTEIKIGDTVMNHLGEIGKVKNIRELMWGHPYEITLLQHSPFSAAGELIEAKKEDLTKGSLCLCSTKIAVGDTVWPHYKVYPDGTPFGEFGMHLSAVTQYHFILLGPISPDAVYYVGEGKRFAETDVEEWWGQAQTLQPMIKKCWDGWDEKFLNENAPTVYKIRGLCGHFH